MRTLIRLPGGAAAPLLHWLVLIGGLAQLANGRVLASDDFLPTCAGAILGTAAGQLLAWLRVRTWMATFVVLFLASVLLLSLWNHGWARSGGSEVLEAFVPAAACGYLSLTSRWTLAGFWFPAVPWSLAILEAERHGSATLGPSWVLWLVLGGLLLATLWAREARRVVHWRTHALDALAEPAERVLLRQAPLRAELRGAWVAAVGIGTITLAAYVAPHLRQWDQEWSEVDHERRQLAAATTSPPASVARNGAAGQWVTCCPEAPPTPAPARRVKEYISPRRHEVDAPPPSPPTSCVTCENGVPIESPPSTSDSVPASGEPMTLADERAAAGAAPLTAPATRTSVTAQALPLATSVEVATSPQGPAPRPTTVASVANAPVEPTPFTHGDASPRAPSSRVASPSSPRFEPVHEKGGASERPVLRWLLALLVAAFAVSVPLRPLRRWLVLRHLRRPWWRETVGQRVSNLWQLALIGLRDAGWHPDARESPQDLARRVGIEGVRVCADVLERARHGVRVDAADLAAMERAAEGAFDAARARAGSIARFASWWRTPSG